MYLKYIKKSNITDKSDEEAEIMCMMEMHLTPYIFLYSIQFYS